MAMESIPIANRNAPVELLKSTSTGKWQRKLTRPNS